MRKLTPRWKESGQFYQKIGAIVFNFQKLNRAGETSSAPVLIWW